MMRLPLVKYGLMMNRVKECMGCKEGKLRDPSWDIYGGPRF